MTLTWTEIQTFISTYPWTQDVAFVVVCFLVALIATRITKAALKRKLGLVNARVLSQMVRVMIWGIFLILILSNLGYDVNSLIAGLGLGGLAFALAAQEVLGNFLGSVSILADKPFKVGDTIRMGEFSGEVLEIGLRSTKLEAKNKTLITIPNRLMASSVVEKLTT